MTRGAPSLQYPNRIFQGLVVHLNPPRILERYETVHEEQMGTAYLLGGDIVLRDPLAGRWFAVSETELETDYRPVADSWDRPSESDCDLSSLKLETMMRIVVDGMSDISARLDRALEPRGCEK